MKCSQVISYLLHFLPGLLTSSSQNANGPCSSHTRVRQHLGGCALACMLQTFMRHRITHMKHGHANLQQLDGQGIGIPPHPPPVILAPYKLPEWEPGGGSCRGWLQGMRALTALTR